mmetsp:Transcript_12368/g.30350  ORF Transcript_12368/g.30350 Transcript_12368/m.30350 type:complete len:201 (+) Transcript_12368:1711-2313(+)
MRDEADDRLSALLLLLVALSVLDTGTSRSNFLGMRPSSGSGSSTAALQMASSVGMLDRSSAVMCSHDMSAAPPPMRTPSARFISDMSVANMVASMPGGHRRAASTMVGMDSTLVTMSMNTLPPSTNRWSSSPSCRCSPVTSTSCDDCSSAARTVPHSMRLRTGTSLRNWLYSTTPVKDAHAAASCTCPRKEGVKPSTLVW